MPTLKLRISQLSTTPKADSEESDLDSLENSTTDTTPATSFFSLAGELRNYIYELHISTYKPAWNKFNNGRLKTTWSPPLARTCRQIRSEVMSFKSRGGASLSEADNLFAVVTDFDFTPLLRLLRGTKHPPKFSLTLENTRQLSLIKRLRIHLRFTESCLDLSVYDARERLRGAGDFDLMTLVRNVSPQFTARFHPPSMRFEFCELWKAIQMSSFGVALLRGSIRRAFRARDLYIARQVMSTDLENSLEGLQRAKCGEAVEKRKIQEEAEKPAARKRIRLGKKFPSPVGQAERQSLESATESESDTKMGVKAVGQGTRLVRIKLAPHHLRMLHASNQETGSA